MLERQRILDRIASGEDHLFVDRSVMSCFHQSATYTPEQEQPNIFEIPNKAKLSDTDSEDDLLDDEFLEQYRAQRLDALQSAVHRLFQLYFLQLSMKSIT